MPEYQNSGTMPPLKPRAKQEPLPCSIHRVKILDYCIGGSEVIVPCQGLTRILKVDTKTGDDIQMWYMSSPEKTEANISMAIFPTRAAVPNNLSFM